MFLLLTILAACGPVKITLDDTGASTLTSDQIDADGDGYTGLYDCNDFDAAVHPQADEVCNNLDDDCDRGVDEDDACATTDSGGGETGSTDSGQTDTGPPDTGTSPTDTAEDTSGDSAGTDTAPTDTAAPCDDPTDADGDGYRVCDGDCNDADNGVHPGAADSWADGGCNNIDDNCDGDVDGNAADGNTDC